MLIVSGIVIWVVTQLPYIGGLVSFIITVLGLGILVASILPKKSSNNEIKDEVVEVSKEEQE